MKIIVAIFLGIVCGLLGSYSGADKTSKVYKRFGIPIILTCISFMMLENWLALLMLNLIWVYSLGYGIPDSTDDGSSIGKFWYYCTNKKLYYTKILTRLTIGLAKIFSLIWIPIINHNYATFILLFYLIVFSNVYFGAFANNNNTFKFLGKNCLVEEFLIYFTDGCLIILLILL